MHPDLGRAAFRIGIFLTLSAGGLLLLLRPGTAEHSITVATLAMGLIFIGLVVLFVRIVGR